MSKAAELAALIGSQTSLSNRNLIINGAMQVDQRNATTTANGYTVDRFLIVKSNFDELVIAVTQDTDNPSGNGFSNSLKVAVTTAESAQASDEVMYLETKLEGQNVQQLAYGTSNAKSVTLSFWVKSPVAGKHSILFYQPTGPRSNLQSYTVSSANTWEYKTITIDGDTSGNIANDNTEEFNVFWTLSAGTDFTGTPHTGWGAYSGTDDFAHSDSVNIAAQTGNFFLTGVQLEVGEQATPFEHRSFGDELAGCQRYYCQIVGGGQGSGANKNIANGSFYTSSYVQGILQLPVTMRANPSLVHTTGSNYYGMIGGYAVHTFNNFILDAFSHKNAVSIYNSGSVSGTQGDGGFLYGNNASAALGFDAEL